MRGWLWTILIGAVLPASATHADPLDRAHFNVPASAGGTGRFVSAHGRRSSVMGYPATGLEVWTYPLQLVSGYQLRFHEAGRIEPFEGQALLSRVESGPTDTVRVYVGPDFVVREHLYTPLDEPAVILRYEVEGRADIRIEARFQPSLDLMWPGALGGQEIAWNEARSAYVEREPVHGYSAIIGSPETVAHDLNGNLATGRPSATSLVMAPRRDPDGIRRARLIIAQDQPGKPASATGIAQREPELRQETATHFAKLLDEATEVVTPDPAVNRALAASVVAGEQAWVCTPDIGCGIVGGYGPSRPGRRPQYAWYFAGDGLVAVEGFLGAGRPERARDELEFIAHYQNRRNGMIWHEMSTSAPLIDWEHRYPYMFVHVDITLQYLATLADYARITGDAAFIRSHWTGITAAWRYARSLVDAKTGLPTIPAGKQSQNEQAVLRDDVRMSESWIEAAGGFAQLARLQGDGRLARDADAALAAARQAVRDHYWNASDGFWFGGHSVTGEPVREQRPDAANILVQGVFTDTQAATALDRLAGPDFQTDWGMRSLSSAHPDYDPNAYSAGAVWGLGSSAISTLFWKLHRPFTAWSAWEGLADWATLDSPGHMHEVLAGDLYHPELESVPEQTWSSAAYLSATMDGLLGLDRRGGERTFTFSPHLPADWNEIEVKRLRVGDAQLNLRLHQDDRSIALHIDNPGPAAHVGFAPQLPLGAVILDANVDGARTAVSAEQHDQDQHARISFIAAHGATDVVIRYSGGVRVAIPSELATDRRS